VDIKRGDEVIVISGDEKGKVGRVLYVYPKTQRILVEKINMIKRHTRARSQQQQQGGIVEKEAPIHISNVALYDPKAKRGVRIRSRVHYETDGDRRLKIKDRISAKSGEVLEKPVHKRS
jgi:large subunit ribosomal protein L24